VCDPALPSMCGFQNQLSLSPYSAPSALQCSVTPGDLLGTCRLPPNTHGDACAVDSECASQHCLKEVGLCKGVDPGQECTPGYPSPCGSFAGVSYFCNAAPGSKGTCVPVALGGQSCSGLSSSCQRGFYCAKQAVASPLGTCVAPFSVATGQTTTIGPFMCATANAVLIQPGPTDRDSLYLCVDTNATSIAVGTECDAGAAPAPGFECVCAQDGRTRLRTVNRLGLGVRAGVWQALHTCMVQSTNILGDSCEFMSQDMYNVRYGSCVYYACYPYFQQLVSVTGGRVFTAPLSQFEPLAQCEVAAIAQYYSDVAAAPCVTLPGMSGWTCFKLSCECRSGTGVEAAACTRDVGRMACQPSLSPPLPSPPIP
jgi:hypothetical protein